MLESPPPDPNPHKPHLVTVPSNACDSHCHVFGPHPTFPYAENRVSTPEDAPLEELEALWDVLGFNRAVIVHSSVYGTDHRPTTDALRRGDGRYRGVAIITPDTSDREVAQFHAEGYRGARVHFTPHLVDRPPSREEIDAIVAKISPYDWHVALHISGNVIVDYEDMICSLRGAVVIDHMGRVDLSEGLETEPVETLLRVAAERDNIWVKLSGADRLAAHPPSMSDSAEFARRIAAAAPDRVVWGTDYPHPNTHGFMANDGDLVDNLATIAPTAELLQKILVDNPSRLFDFPR